MNGGARQACRDSMPFCAIVARTRTIRRAIGPVAYDCVKVMVVREGSAILSGQFGRAWVNAGDVVLLDANALCGGEPEGYVTVTTVYADTGYVLDQLRWQYAGVVRDRIATQGLANAICTGPIQVLCLGEERVQLLTPCLDELVLLSLEGHCIEDFFRMQALWLSVVHVIAPFIKVSSASGTTSRNAGSPKRRLAPVRPEARQVAELLREYPAQRWTLDALAQVVHLSPSQLSRVFADAYGKSPLAFLNMVRAENLARYLRETEMPVTDAMHRVGWHSRSHGTELFRQHVGVTPGHYRLMRGREAG